MSSAKQLTTVQSVVNDLVAELHAKGECGKIGLTRESFAAILCEVGTKHAASGAAFKTVDPEGSVLRWKVGLGGLR